MPKVRYQFDAPLLFSYAEEQLRKRVLFSLDDGRAYPAWDWSFLCEALLNAYRRTGDDRHLALVRNAIDHAYSLRDIDRNIIDPRFGVPRETWGIVKDDAWATVVTTPGRIVTPALDFLMIAGIRDDILEKSIAAVELCLQDFVSFGDEGLFKRPAMDDWEPLNHSVSFGRALLRLFSLTEDERYLTVVKQLATFFKRSLVLEEDDYYGWAYRPNREDRHKGYPTNFWKADIDLAFVVDCHKQKIVFDGLDIGRFSQTLKKRCASLRLHQLPGCTETCSAVTGKGS